MPITTPDFALADYRGDKDHFKHILDHLFIPAIKKAELEPIPPTTKGSEIIHGEVVKNIETSDLVLCDISCLNPNVFFELGIRTALNKAVCLVKDNITKDVPFDTNAINHHEYRCHLNIWENEKEIEKLYQHLKDTIERSDNKNSLWKYFSITSRAESLSQATEGTDKYDYLVMQMDAVRRQLEYLNDAKKEEIPDTRIGKRDLDALYQIQLLKLIATEQEISLNESWIHYNSRARSIELWIPRGALNYKQLDILNTRADTYGLKLRVYEEPKE